MTKNDHIRLIVQLLGALGYLATALLWLWAIMLWMPMILDSGAIEIFTVKNIPPAQQVVQPTIETPSLVSVGIAVAATIGSIVLAVYFAMRLPRTIVKRSSDTVHGSGQLLVSRLTHNKKVSKKKRLALSAQVMIAIKIAISIVPLVSVFIASWYTLALSADVVWTVAVFLAVVAIMCFGLQWLITRYTKIDYATLW